ncbi:MAG TPA: hypothetical protein VIV66_10750 [Pyrinomonadaceae bacterium]
MSSTRSVDLNLARRFNAGDLTMAHARRVATVEVANIRVSLRDANTS